MVFPDSFERKRELQHSSLNTETVRGRLLAAVESLPEPERLVLALCEYEDFSMDEVATILDLPSMQVHALHESAMCKVREAMVASKARP